MEVTVLETDEGPLISELVEGRALAGVQHAWGLRSQVRS